MGWREDALCADLPPIVMVTLNMGDPQAVTEAKEICTRCPVADPCLQDALSFPNEDDQVTIRGGLTPAERRKIRPRGHYAAMSPTIDTCQTCDLPYVRYHGAQKYCSRKCGHKPRNVRA